jgi:hypothetical protein
MRNRATVVLLCVTLITPLCAAAQQSPMLQARPSMAQIQKMMRAPDSQLWSDLLASTEETSLTLDKCTIQWFFQKKVFRFDIRYFKDLSYEPMGGALLLHGDTEGKAVYNEFSDNPRDRYESEFHWSARDNDPRNYWRTKIILFTLRDRKAKQGC